MADRDADVVVVGAGYAGLSAARHLVAEGAKVLVMEARGRVGGRVWTRATEAGTPIDVGGAWIGPGQDAIVRAREGARRRHLPDVVEGRDGARHAGRHEALQRQLPEHQPDRAREPRPRDLAARQDGEAGAARRAVERAAGRAVGRAERGHVDRLEGEHREQGRARSGRVAAARTVDLRSFGGLAAAHAVPHPLGGQPEQAARSRGRIPAGPHQRRRADHRGTDGRRARRQSPARHAGP